MNTINSNWLVGGHSCISQVKSLYTQQHRTCVQQQKGIKHTPTCMSHHTTPHHAAPQHTHMHLQSLAIPAIMGGGDYLLAAQTGSGKTLAYLLPLVHLLKSMEGQEGMERRGKRPKILILVPTKELVEQVGVLLVGGGDATGTGGGQRSTTGWLFVNRGPGLMVFNLGQRPTASSRHGVPPGHIYTLPNSVLDQSSRQLDGAQGFQHTGVSTGGSPVHPVQRRPAALHCQQLHQVALIAACFLPGTTVLLLKFCEK